MGKYKISKVKKKIKLKSKNGRKSSLSKKIKLKSKNRRKSSVNKKKRKLRGGEGENDVDLPHFSPKENEQLLNIAENPLMGQIFVQFSKKMKEICDETDLKTITELTDLEEKLKSFLMMYYFRNNQNDLENPKDIKGLRKKFNEYQNQILIEEVDEGKALKIRMLNNYKCEELVVAKKKKKKFFQLLAPPHTYETDKIDCNNRILCNWENLQCKQKLDEDIDPTIGIKKHPPTKLVGDKSIEEKKVSIEITIETPKLKELKTNLSDKELTKDKKNFLENLIKQVLIGYIDAIFFAFQAIIDEKCIVSLNNELEKLTTEYYQIPESERIINEFNRKYKELKDEYDTEKKKLVYLFYTSLKTDANLPNITEELLFHIKFINTTNPFPIRGAGLTSMKGGMKWPFSVRDVNEYNTTGKILTGLLMSVVVVPTFYTLAFPLTTLAIGVSWSFHQPVAWFTAALGIYIWGTNGLKKILGLRERTPEQPDKAKDKAIREEQGKWEEFLEYLYQEDFESTKIEELFNKFFHWPCKAVEGLFNSFIDRNFHGKYKLLWRGVLEPEFESWLQRRARM